MRTDENNNPAAFTTGIAHQAGLILGQDYEQGDPFTSNGVTYYTAKLLGDPISLTETVISKIGFFTATLSPRWEYVPDLVKHMWSMLDAAQRKSVIALMYHHEGGTAMQSLFTTPINLQYDDAFNMSDKVE